MVQVPILNTSMELAQYADRWTFNEKYDCWCLEDVLYTPAAKVPAFQRLSIFAPRELVNEDGTIPAAARSVPVVFANSAAGYMQMPHTWLDSPRCTAPQYLERGWVYVTCGCRGRDSRDEAGKLVGKGPSCLIDLKTALRFLRHNRACLPGDWDRIVSVGSSAGGAMSTLLAVTGDNESYLPLLRENGAFLEESDAVWAAQIYCPIVDLEHADIAYEWMFQKDVVSEEGALTPFQTALSPVLAKRYIQYFNSLELKDPATGEPLRLNEDGRSGSGYDYLMARLDDSATDYLKRLQQGKLAQEYSVEDYLSGNYTYRTRAPRGPRKPQEEPDARTPGEKMLRPPKEQQTAPSGPQMVEVHGADKHAWLTWDGQRAHISDLDSYVLNHRRRMKPCTSFDRLEADSGENQAFGTPEADYVHYNGVLADAVAELAEQFPEEAARYQAAFAQAKGDADLAERVRLYNPLAFIGTGGESRQAEHYRIRVGASDADTSFTIGMTLALRLVNANCGSVDYALVWEQPHCEADYPGEVCDWIASICKK
ncbi:MAG: hypothetical protein ACI3XJ_08355 [Oscillospiraceae bacterium]